MSIFREKLSLFLNKYLVFILIAFGILTLFPYVTAFKGLEVNNTAGIVYRGIIVGLFIILFLISFIAFRKLPNRHFIISCLIYLVSQFITIFVSPLIKQIDIPALQTIMGIGLIFVNIMTIFIVLYMFKFYKPDSESLNIVCYFFLGLGLAVCLYTYLFQYKEIGAVLTDEHGWNYQVTSIFTSKGVYGFVLLISSIFTIIIALNTKKYWLYCFPAFFLFNSFLCRAKTSILCILIILIFALIYHLVKSWKLYKKRWTIALSISIGIIFILAILTFVPGMQFGLFKKLNYFFKETILNDGVTVVKDRIYKTANIIKAVDYPLGIMFGCGERITNYIIGSAGAEIAGDNQYAANYATGGIIKFILYVIFIIFVIYKILKRKEQYKSFSILFVSIILLTGFFDNNSLIGVNSCFLLTAPFIFASPFVQQDSK